MLRNGAILRGQRNRMGRPLAPPQIHWKIIWMPSKYHQTASECWRIPGTQKRLRKEVGQNVKDKKRDKRVRDGDSSQGGSRKREVSKHQETLSLVGLWGFGISEGNRTGRKKWIKPTDYAPNSNSQRRSSPDARVCHQQAGAEQGRVGCTRKDQAWMPWGQSEGANVR